MEDDIRLRPPRHAPERETLHGFLANQRATLLWKLDGLDTVQATHRLVPSETTLLGLVKHCMDVERWWFRVVMAGEDVPLTWSEEAPTADWQIEPGETVATLVAAYRAEATACDRAVAGYALDDTARRAGQPETLRWIYVHMIREIARHCGHADILRELTDGATGE